jgi:hypothetical protein
VLEACTTEFDAFDLLDRIEAIKAVCVGAILPAEKEIIFPLLVKWATFSLVVPGEHISFFNILHH